VYAHLVKLILEYKMDQKLRLTFELTILIFKII